MQLCIGVLLIGLLGLAQGKTCNWSAHPDSKVIYGSEIQKYTSVTENTCKSECEASADCEIAQYEANTQECYLFSYDWPELTSLEYVVFGRYFFGAVGVIVWECTESVLCECEIFGDPILSPFSKVGGNIKITDNGVWNFATSLATGVGNCDLSSHVTTDAPYPGKPNMAIVTSLTVKVGDKTVKVVHTPLIDEVAGIYLGNGASLLTLPVNRPDPGLLISEHSGTIELQFVDCPVRLTYSDFRNSRARLVVDKAVYTGLEGLCGRCGNGGRNFIDLVPE